MSDTLKDAVELSEPTLSDQARVVAEFLQDDTPFHSINADLHATPRPRQRPDAALSVSDSLALIEEDT
jgi:hypothetical protein